MTPFRIGAFEIAAGQRKTVELPISVLANHTPISLPVHVIHGVKPGPTFFISGVVHGDEILGVEIVRRVVGHKALKELAGTLLAVPIVNTFGFLNHSRYMPDRRDLNRSFPGSDHGSLASLLADLFMKEVVRRSQYGIDLHTAALHRTNLPQIRIAPDEPELLKMAKLFAPPVILISKLREGTLRQCARDQGVKVMLYEAGEALRFDEVAIETGVTGILRVMASLKMIALAPHSESHHQTAISLFQHLAAGAGRRRAAQFAADGGACLEGREGRRDFRSAWPCERSGDCRRRRHHHRAHQPSHRQPRRRAVPCGADEKIKPGAAAAV